jgi:hypothetical protein
MILDPICRPSFVDQVISWGINDVVALKTEERKLRSSPPSRPP